MTDKFSTAKRKIIMQAVKGKNSKPEKIIRSLIFKLGFRYRLHDSSLPGKPDLIFRAAKKAIFVHGCYWHRHNCKKGDSIPSVNQDFWEKKFDNNRKRVKGHQFWLIHMLSINLFEKKEITLSGKFSCIETPVRSLKREGQMPIF